MYLHIGSDVLISTSEIIALISYRGTETGNSINTKFLQHVCKNGGVIDISNTVRKNAKSLVLVDNDLVYISPVTPLTIYKRSKNFGLSEGLKVN
jgi:regulator of extracellular matrix RemA (YlzA/DUF370 family)